MVWLSRPRVGDTPNPPGRLFLVPDPEYFVVPPGTLGMGFVPSLSGSGCPRRRLRERVVDGS